MIESNVVHHDHFFIRDDRPDFPRAWRLAEHDAERGFAKFMKTAPLHERSYIWSVEFKEMSVTATTVSRDYLYKFDFYVFKQKEEEDGTQD